jgi:Ca2+/Na+ antiporter
VFAITGWRVSRAEGLVLLLAYAAYLTYLAIA